MHGRSEMTWQSFAFMIMYSCIVLSLPSGNYGNKFDESVAPCNTPPVNAVYDGCHYHYLPWGQDKPCVCVECSWEDIAFRLEPINVITRMAERVVSPWSWWLSFFNSLFFTELLSGEDLYHFVPLPKLEFLTRECTKAQSQCLSPEMTNCKYRHSDKKKFWKLSWPRQDR